MTGWTILAIILVLATTPFVVYYSVRLAAYGWYRGKQNAQDMNRKRRIMDLFRLAKEKPEERKK